MFFPIPLRTGLARSIASSSPPHIKERVPLSAPITPPDIGVSIKVIPTAYAPSTRVFDPEGSIVDESNIRVPGLADSNTPPGPAIASVT